MLIIILPNCLLGDRLNISPINCQCISMFVGFQAQKGAILDTCRCLLAAYFITVTPGGELQLKLHPAGISKLV